MIKRLEHAPDPLYAKVDLIAFSLPIRICSSGPTAQYRRLLSRRLSLGAFGYLVRLPNTELIEVT